jgi:hypothetical protein
MINKQYRKKSLKGSFLTNQQEEGLILRIVIRGREKHFFRAEAIFDNREWTTPQETTQI